MVDEEGIYIALIGDIRGSRELEDRAEVQRRFEAVLDGLNHELPHGIAAKLVITTGDEFQGLFTTGTDAVHAMARTTELMAPIQLTFGLGVGHLDTPLKDEAVGMDGPCFHRARQGLTTAKEERRWARLGNPISFVGDQANALAILMGALRSDWTPRQTEYIRATRQQDTQKAVADRFGVSPSVVSESLKAAHFRDLRAGEVALAGCLDRLIGDRQAREGHR